MIKTKIMISKSILLFLTIGLLFSCGVSKNTSTKTTIEKESEINGLMDKWHNDVIAFELDSYFNVMDESFIFLGTDPKERWSKDEFYGFCKPYFEKKTSWNFTPLWSNVYFSEDGKIAWFEEQLTTWMEECRGSGVLIKKDNEWKFQARGDGYKEDLNYCVEKYS